jgi:hypothetical protein
VLPLPRIPASHLHATHAYARCARGLAPFIVIGNADHPAWVERERSNGVRLSDATALVARFPHVRLAPHGGQQHAAAVGGAAAPAPPHAHSSRASTARCLQWNMDAGAWRRVARLLGPLPPLFTSDEPWLGVCAGVESLRAAFVRTTHWRTLRVGTWQAGTLDHKGTRRTSSCQVCGGGGGGGGGAKWLAAHAKSPPRLPPHTHARAAAGL